MAFCLAFGGFLVFFWGERGMLGFFVCLGGFFVCLRGWFFFLNPLDCLHSKLRSLLALAPTRLQH